jgi:hypothetical protein
MLDSYFTLFPFQNNWTCYSYSILKVWDYFSHSCETSSKITVLCNLNSVFSMSFRLNTSNIYLIRNIFGKEIFLSCHIVYVRFSLLTSWGIVLFCVESLAWYDLCIRLEQNMIALHVILWANQTNISIWKTEVSLLSIGCNALFCKLKNANIFERIKEMT